MECNWCKKNIIQKSSRHKFCSTSCRVYAHNSKHNKPNFIEPAIKRHPESIRSSISNNKPLIGNTQSLDKNDYLKALEAERQYWVNVYNQAENTNSSFWTVVGICIGLYQKENKLIASTLLGFVGHEIDKAFREKRKVDNVFLMQKAIDKIKGLDKKISDSRSPKPLEAEGYTINKTANKLIINAKEYTQYETKGLNFSNSKWGYYFGSPSDNFKMLLYGAPGSGKTTLAVKFSEYFQKNFGNVIYLASEQSGIDYSLQKLLKRENASFNVHTNPNKDNNIESIIKNYKLVVFDSVQSLKLTPERIKQISEKNPNTAFILVSQVNKDGAFKGSNSFLHDVDIEVCVDGGKAEIGKNRFLSPHKEKMEIFNN